MKFELARTCSLPARGNRKVTHYFTWKITLRLPVPRSDDRMKTDLG